MSRERFSGESSRVIARGDDDDSGARVCSRSEPGGRNRGHGKYYHKLHTTGKRRRRARILRASRACSGACRRASVSAGRGGSDGGRLRYILRSSPDHHDCQTGGGLLWRRVAVAGVAGLGGAASVRQTPDVRRAVAARRNIRHRRRSPRRAGADAAAEDSVSPRHPRRRTRSATLSRLRRAPRQRPARVGGSRRSAAPVASAPPAEPAIELIGVAETAAAKGVVRTAIISALSGELFLVKEGETIAARYRVGTVGADAVELNDLLSGTVRRLALRD